jgi:hypothetical protein
MYIEAMSISKRRLVAGLVLLLGNPACTATIGRQNPRPSVAIAPQARSLRLVLGSGVPDGQAFPVAHCVVEDWHSTLVTGFRNGFGTAFRLASGSEGDLSLTLDEVRLEIGDYKPAHARIQYKATISGGGTVLRRSAGTAVKPFFGYAGTTTGLVSGDVDGAVEAMYEEIARELSSIVEPAPAAAPAVASAAPAAPAPAARRRAE